MTRRSPKPASRAGCPRRGSGETRLTLVIVAALVATVALATLGGRLAWRRGGRGTKQLARALEEERRRSEEARQAAAQARALVERLSLGVTLHDPEGRVTFANQAALRILGLSSETVLGSLALSPQEDLLSEDGTPLATDQEPVRAALRSRNAVRDVVVGRWREGSGERHWLLVSAEPRLTADGAVEEVMCTFSDITDERRARERIRHLAYHDGLTQLPNRELFLDRLGVALVQARRQQSGVAVVFVDLDNFKVVNDSLGHSVGDALLRTLSRRLKSTVREADTVARFGGDEFTLFLPGVQDADDVLRIVRKLQDTLRAPVDLDGREFSVHASIGVALFPQDAQDAEGLIRSADTAMYRAKELGHGQLEFYTPALGVRVREQLDIDGRLRRAVAAGELELHYQTVTDLGQGMVRGFEALVRWRDGGRLIPPAEFVPAAETMGGILVLGAWVLRKACEELRQVTLEIGGSPWVAVNLSARQFHAVDILEQVRRALEESGLAPARLELEITESAALQGQQATLERLKQLKELGVRLAIDDFGTGFSSFAYLQRFPIDTLKIDRSFVEDVATNPSSSGIARAIVAVGHQLGLRIVAEGVETEEQLRLLSLLGCDFVQGFLFGTPVPAPMLASRVAEAEQLWHTRFAAL